MHKEKRLKSILAVLLAVAMALTGVWPGTGVQAAQETEAVSGQETESVSDSGTAAELAQTETAETETSEETVSAGESTPQQETTADPTVGAETETETERGSEMETETGAAQDSEAESVQGTEAEDGSMLAEQEEESSTEETETEEETNLEDPGISAKEIASAAALSVGENKGALIKKGEQAKWFSFTPDEEGAYTVYLTMVGFDDVELDEFRLDDFNFYCAVDGKWKNSLGWINNETQETFMLESGKTVYLSPRIYDWEWEKIAPMTEVTAVFEIQKVDKGTAAVNDGKFTLAYRNVSFDMDMEIGVNHVTMRGTRNQDDGERYRLYTFFYAPATENNNMYEVGYFDSNNSSEEWQIRWLDRGTRYDVSYVLMLDDWSYGKPIAWFGGTGFPFEVSTRQTEHVGGMISKASADFKSVTVTYELFEEDTDGAGGYLRYKQKDTEEEWNYLHASNWNGMEGITFAAQSNTTYIVELVSTDKKTVYDSAEVTTEAYTGEVAVSVNEASVTGNSAEIDISGYKGAGQLRVYVDYTDSYGTAWGCSSAQYATVSVDGMGKGTFTIRDLEAAAAYKDVAVEVYEGHKSIDTLICKQTVSFTTREAAIKKENTLVGVKPLTQNTAEVTIAVEGMPTDSELVCSYKCRAKGSTESEWKATGAFGLRSDMLPYTFMVSPLEIYTVYEVRYNIDGIVGTVELDMSEASDGAVRPQIAVTKDYVNALELECRLEGAAGSSDRYTFDAAVYEEEDGHWTATQRTELAAANNWTAKKTASLSCIVPGQIQKWKVTVYKNGVPYYTEYFEYATKKLELDILSVTGSSSYLRILYTAANPDSIIRDNGIDYSAFRVQLRKKGTQEWETVGDWYPLYFGEDGAGSTSAWLSAGIEPSEYEIRLVSKGDDSIVYGQVAFMAESNWYIYPGSSLIYDYDEAKIGNPYIHISGNYGMPTAEVENENIVKVKEIRKSRIYLDVNNIGMTKLYVTADGITKEVTVIVTIEQELYYLEGADKSLADVPLPEKYSWLDDSVSPAADDSSPVQCFTVKFTEEGTVKYASMPVKVSKLEDITIKGKDTVGAGKDRIFSVYYSGAGYEINDKETYEITQRWSGNENLRISGEDSGRNVTVTGGGTAGTYDLTLTVTVKNLCSQKMYEITETQPVRVIGSGFVDNLIVKSAQRQPQNAVPYVENSSVVSGTVIEIDYDDYDKETKSKLQLEAKTNTGTQIKDADVSWSADASILEVDNAGLVTVKGAGTAYVNVTANDEGQYQEPVAFHIYDYRPLFDTTELTVNKGNAQGVRLAYSAQNGNVVTDIAIKDAQSKFEVKRQGADWYFCVKDKNSYTSKTTENVMLAITTPKREYTQEMTVTVDVSVPTATFKQTVKPNLFFVDSEAVFTIKSSYEIEEIQTADMDAINFHVKKYDALTGQLTLTANKLAENIADYTKKNSANAKASIKVKFKGYDEPIVYDNIKVSVQNKAVSLKAEETFVIDSMTTVLPEVFNGKVSYDISGSAIVEGSLAVSPKGKKDNVKASMDGGRLKLDYTGAGAASYTLYLHNESKWTKDIKLTGKISKADISKLSMKSTKTKATLNTNYPETVTVGFNIKGSSSIPFTLGYECSSEALKVECNDADKTVTISMKDPAATAAKKYIVKVYGKVNVNGTEMATKKMSLAITVSKKAPAVKLSAKGSINLAGRNISGITYTASVKDMDAGVSKVAIANENAVYFGVKMLSDKTFSIKALPDANIAANVKYELKLRIKLTNGYELPDELKVIAKPVNKLPGIKVSTSKGTIDRTHARVLGIKLTYADGYTISSIKLTGNNSEYFTITMDGQDKVNIRLSDRGAELENGQYMLKYQIYIAGADTKKPITKSIKVTVQ